MLLLTNIICIMKMRSNLLRLILRAGFVIYFIIIIIFLYYEERKLKFTVKLLKHRQIFIFYQNFIDIKKKKRKKMFSLEMEIGPCRPRASPIFKLLSKLTSPPP